MRLRPLDTDDLQAYLREIRPRFLTLRIRAGRVRLAWWVPSWALEEPLRLALRLLPLAAALAPDGVRRLAARAGLDGRLAPAGPWWRAADELFSERHRDLLELPDGAPLLDVTTADARIVVAQARP